MPTRETSSVFDAPVAVAGSGIQAAVSAAPALEGAGGATVSRCPASLLLCEGGRPQWACRACKRRYRQPPGASEAGEGAASASGAAAGPQPVPPCVFCGVPLGPAVPAMLLAPPCCS